MTQRNENSVEYLNNGGAYLRKWHNSSGGDTPAVLRNAGILNENNYTTSVGFQLNQPIIIDAYGGIESNVEYATAGFKSWVNPSTPSNIKALSNLLEKFKQSDFNLAVTAGESREAWHMISDRMFKFSEALRRTRRGDLSGALRALGSTKRASRHAQRKLDAGDVSGSFLELHYGWVPTMRDIYAASELVTKPAVERTSIRTSDHVDGPDRDTYVPAHQGDAKTFSNKRTVYHIAKLSSKEVSMAVRLGLAQPMSVAWELTTLSFVADWFLPIGDLIQAVEASYILPVGKYIKTDVLRQHCQLSLPAGGHCYGFNQYALSRNSGILVYRGTEMTRTVGSAVPNNIFDGTGPRQSLIDLDLSLSQVASASALLHQAFRAFRR